MCPALVLSEDSKRAPGTGGGSIPARIGGRRETEFLRIDYNFCVL